MSKQPEAVLEYQLIKQLQKLGYQKVSEEECQVCGGSFNDEKNWPKRIERFDSNMHKFLPLLGQGLSE